MWMFEHVLSGFQSHSDIIAKGHFDDSSPLVETCFEAGVVKHCSSYTGGKLDLASGLKICCVCLDVASVLLKAPPATLSSTFIYSNRFCHNSI